MLHPQDVDDVRVGDHADLVRRRAQPIASMPRGIERRRADERRARPDEPERLDERARDA